VILERALKRLEWERVQEKEAKAKAAKEDAEREAMMSVDWHEFAVVETIEFYDDEVDDLPAPMTLKEVSGAGCRWGGLVEGWGRHWRQLGSLVTLLQPAAWTAAWY
jgi:hypothetical protein